MGTDQRFSLRWNNYQSHLVTAFESLLDKKDFVDVTLGVEGKKLPAHKMLLSACSPYFRELLKENPCQHPIIILRDINYLDLHSLLQFMYNGEVNVAQEQLNSFLKTAESLKIRGLTDMDDGERDPEPSRPLARERLHASERRSPPLPPKKMKTSFSDLPPVTPPISLPPPRMPPPPPVKQELIDIGEDSEIDQDQDVTRNGYANESETSDGAVNSINADYEHEDYHERTVVVRGANMEAGVGHGAGLETTYDHGHHLNYPNYGAKVMYSSGVDQTQEMVECPSCGKNFRSRRAWKNHNVVHESEGGQLLCKVCGKQQSSGTNYRRHLKMNHGIEGDPFSY